MDLESVQAAAEQHAQATVSKDFDTAGSVLTDTAKAKAGDVMAAMPKPLTGFQIDAVDAQGQEYVAAIRYVGEDAQAVVLSRWAEIDGRPMITDLQVQ
jgi:hypothetical protein